jgi:hypothetical protein
MNNKKRYKNKSKKFHKMNNKGIWIDSDDEMQNVNSRKRKRNQGPRRKNKKIKSTSSPIVISDDEDDDDVIMIDVQEIKRKQLERENAKRKKQAQEAKRKKLLLEQEEAKRKRLEQEEAKRKKLEQQEEAKRKKLLLEQEEAKRKRSEQEEAKKKKQAQEEAKRKKLEQQEEAKRKKLEQQEAKRKKLEQQEAKKKKLEQQKVKRKKLEQQEAKRKKLEQQEAKKKKLEQQEAKKKKLEQQIFLLDDDEDDKDEQDEKKPTANQLAETERKKIAKERSTGFNVKGDKVKKDMEFLIQPKREELIFPHPFENRFHLATDFYGNGWNTCYVDVNLNILFGMGNPILRTHCILPQLKKWAKMKWTEQDAQILKRRINIELDETKYKRKQQQEAFLSEYSGDSSSYVLQIRKKFWPLILEVYRFFYHAMILHEDEYVGKGKAAYLQFLFEIYYCHAINCNRETVLRNGYNNAEAFFEFLFYAFPLLGNPQASEFQWASESEKEFIITKEMEANLKAKRPYLLLALDPKTLHNDIYEQFGGYKNLLKPSFLFYELVGISVHNGSQHFICYVKAKNSQWFLVNGARKNIEKREFQQMIEELTMNSQKWTIENIWYVRTTNS